MPDSRRTRQPSSRLWQIVPAVATASLGAGLVFGTLFSDELKPVDSVWVAAALVIVQAAFLWGRSRAPKLAFVAISICDFVILFTSSGELSVGTLGVMIAAYSLRMRLPAPAARIWLGAAMAAAVIVTLLTASDSGVLAAGWLVPFAFARALLAYGLPYFVAEFVVARVSLLDALRERAELAERERERSAQHAVQQERALMARELHDIAAHHLSGIIVSAQAAGALLPLEPERATEYMRTVTREAQLTLTNLRQTVGLLRMSPDGELSPLPSVAQIPDLVAQRQARGIHVSLSVSGQPIPLGPLAEITAYRMVQESLTNAETHASGAECDVSVNYSKSGLRIRVHNVAPRHAGIPNGGRRGSGHGLLGMRERTQLIGGHLETGPDTDGGWVNELAIPPLDNDAPTAEQATEQRN